MTGALVAVGIAALVGITIAIVGIPPKHEGPAWSSWKPTTGGLQGATEIASHIAGAYRDQGRQLVKVDANDISYKGIPLLVALRKSAEEGGAIQVHDEKGVLYQMCGLGVNCQIDGGKPSPKRMLPAAPRGPRAGPLQLPLPQGRQAGRRAHPGDARARLRPSRCTSAATSCVPSSTAR